MKQKIFDDLSQRISALLPDSMAGVRTDIENNIHHLLQETLNKLNLVTREEFDLQSALLQRSREKLDRLEKQLTTLIASAAEQTDAKLPAEKKKKIPKK